MSPLTESQRNSLGRAGLTLVDVTVTMLVLGIMASSSIPAFSSFLLQARADSAAKRIRADLELARQTAIAESSTTTVSFSPMTGSYSVTGVDHPDHPGQAYAVDLNTYPYNSTMPVVSFGVGSTVQFNRYGTPDFGGNLQVQSGSATQTVTVDPDTGNASVP